MFIIKCLTIIFCFLTLVSCTKSDTKVIDTMSDSQKLYLEFDSKIQNNIKTYNDEKPSYTTKQYDNIFYRSTEGGHIVKEYKNNIFVAYKSTFFGELGKSEYNYHNFNDLIYLVKTITKYNSPIYYVDDDIEKFDPEKSTHIIEEFIKNKNQLYMLDRVNKDVILVQDKDQLSEFLTCENDVLLKDTPETFSKYNIFVVNQMLLGGFYNNNWINKEKLMPLIRDTELYKTYLNGDYNIIQPGTKEDFKTEPLYHGESINLHHNYHYGVDYVIAFSGNYDLKLSLGQTLSIENDIYVKLFDEFMINEGYKGINSIDSIIKFDLENDGVDEVFISGFNTPNEEHTYPARVLYMRKLIDGEVENIIFLPDDSILSTDFKKIIAFCDLNNDGLFEVVVDIKDVGYRGYSVFELKDKTFNNIFENGFDH